MKYDVSDIFTPSSPATYTFIERHELNGLLVDALNTKGKQLIIYGHSGTGKSTLLYNKLNQTYESNIVSRCTADMKFSQLVIEAFDQLGKFFISSNTRRKDQKIGVNLGGEYKLIKAALNIESTTSSSEESIRIVPPQLTPQKLASFFGSSNSCWVIDDFPKLPESEKKYLAQWMKVFMDESVNFPKVKIIAMGAVTNAKQIVELDKELTIRVTEILVPFMSPPELREIIEKGEAKLSIYIEEEVKQKIIKFSNGLAAITHELCAILCRNNGLYETSDSRITFDSNDFNEAIGTFLKQRSGYLNNIYEKAIQEKKENKVPIYYHILRCIILSKKNFLTIKDVSKYFKDHKHPQQEDLLRYLLTQLTKESRGNILDYDEDTESWFIVDPLFKVYCLCKIDLSKSLLQAQMDLFTVDSIQKSKKKKMDEEIEMVKKMLQSGEYFDI